MPAASAPLDPDELYARLEEKLRQAAHPVDMDRVRTAYQVAKTAHEGQKRKDGSPYVTHCVAAADIAADMGLDEDSIVAALLHDVIEDTSLTHEDIARQFGSSVADIVEGVTKLTRVQYTSKEDEQMENLRKMLLAMAKDIRVILIKIADRLHNMRTMAYQSPEKQRTKSLETMEIYAPIAHRLGMQRVKWELEDLSLQYLDPQGYQEIMGILESRMPELEAFMDSMEAKIRARLEREGVKASVFCRIKHVYSIYRKMYTQKLEMSGIFDLCAFRVIVDTIPDCYNVLGIIHDMFKPVPGRFKDYISTPNRPRSRTCTRACTPRSSAARASPSKCKSAHGRCITPPSTASPPTGSTRWATAARLSAPATRTASPGCGACWNPSRSPTPPTLCTT